MEAKTEEAMEVNTDGQETPSSNGGPTAPNGPGGDGNGRGSAEDRKIFVGGISYDTTNEDLASFFKQFGEVEKAEVKYDQLTNRSRGFAFVEFADSSSVVTVLKQKTREIKGKSVEVKPAKSRENKKIFVGGLPYEWTEEQLKSHFEKFGKVEDVEWPFDRQRQVRRNFAFVVFEEEACADAAAREQKQTMGERTCDVKKATPQGRGRGGGGMGGYLQMGTRGRGRGRGAYGAGAYAYGSRGGGGYGAGAGWTGYGGGAWGDWYGGAGGAADAYGSYYGSQGYYDGYGYEDPASLYAAYGAWQGWGNQGAGAVTGATTGYDAYGAGQAGSGSMWGGAAAAAAAGTGAGLGRGGRYNPY